MRLHQRRPAQNSGCIKQAACAADPACSGALSKEGEHPALLVVPKSSVLQELCNAACAAPWAPLWAALVPARCLTYCSLLHAPCAPQRTNPAQLWPCPCLTWHHALSSAFMTPLRHVKQSAPPLFTYSGHRRCPITHCLGPTPPRPFHTLSLHDTTLCCHPHTSCTTSMSALHPFTIIFISCHLPLTTPGTCFPHQLPPVAGLTQL